MYSHHNAFFRTRQITVITPIEAFGSKHNLGYAPHAVVGAALTHNGGIRTAGEGFRIDVPNYSQGKIKFFHVDARSLDNHPAHRAAFAGNGDDDRLALGNARNHAGCANGSHRRVRRTPNVVVGLLGIKKRQSARSTYVYRDLRHQLETLFGRNGLDKSNAVYLIHRGFVGNRIRFPNVHVRENVGAKRH